MEKVRLYSGGYCLIEQTVEDEVTPELVKKIADGFGAEYDRYQILTYSGDIKYDSINPFAYLKWQE